MWYPRHELQFRIALFWGGATIAGAFSGLFAFGISFMDGVGGKEGWSWIFIIEGLITVIVGIVALFSKFPPSRLSRSGAWLIICVVMVDFPSTASFITPEERVYVTYRQSAHYSYQRAPQS